MGWCSGTEIFDAVVKSVLESKVLSDDGKYEIIYPLVVKMFNHDWDCESDSDYYDNPIVRKAFKAAAPNLTWE